MKWRIFLLLILAVGAARGQKELRLYLEDLRGEGFRVLVNQYYQNEQPYQRLLLEGLPPGRHELIFLLDSHYLRRPLPALEAGLHHYVITENHRGQIQLRYRGTLKSRPANSASLRLRQDQLWERSQSPLLAMDQRPLQPLAALSLPSKQQERDSRPPKNEEAVLGLSSKDDGAQSGDSAFANTTTLSKPTESPARESPADPQSQMRFVQEDLHPKAAETVDSLASETEAKTADILAVASSSKPALAQDSSESPVAPVVASPEAERPKPAEDKEEEDEKAWLARLAAQSYEYEKMQMARERLQAPLSAELCRAILKAFSYDQTRLLFLRQALSTGAFPYEKREQVLGAFEFEMSKQQVISLEKPLSP